MSTRIFTPPKSAEDAPAGAHTTADLKDSDVAPGEEGERHDNRLLRMEKYYQEHKAIIDAASTGIGSMDQSHLQNTLKEFAKTYRVVQEGLDMLGQINPFIRPATITFKVAIELDMMRRVNNEKVGVLNIQMQQMMCALFRLHKIPNPDEDRLRPLIDQIARDIRLCGSMCDVYMRKSPMARLLSHKQYEARLAALSKTFMDRRNELVAVLHIHNAPTARSATKTPSVSLPQIEELFQMLETPQEREALEFITQNGGPSVVVAQNDLIKVLAEKSRESTGGFTGRGFSNKSKDELKEKLMKELAEDIGKAVEQNLAHFLQEADNQGRDIEEALDKQGKYREYVVKVLSTGVNEILSFDDAKAQQVEVSTSDTSPVPTPRHLIELLSDALQREQRREALVNLKGKDAQLLIDFLHSVLHEPKSVDLDCQNYILVLLYRLSKESALYPQCYLLKDVVLDRKTMVAESGGFCDVYRINYGGQLLCLRVLRIREHERDRFLRSYSKETILWSESEHPNILPFYGLCYLGDESPKRVCLVSPWMENGNVMSYLMNHPSVPRKPLICDIACGLEYLHRKDIVHGDLKGANILVNNMGRACLADFGLSTVHADRTYAAATTAVFGCTIRYASPELLEEDERPTKATDVWAVGCVFFEILAGVVPFHECRTDAQVMRKMSRGGLPGQLNSVAGLSEFDESTRDLIHRCWAESPKSRPTCEQIVRELPTQGLSEEGGHNDTRGQLVREKQCFRDVMRRNQNIRIDLARVEQILNEH